MQKTEAIKYAGSKLKLLPDILQMASSVKAKTIFDGFAGTTRVSQYFAQSGYKVISSDISIWSETFANCYLKGGLPDKYKDLISHLNQVKPFSGWFTETYGGPLFVEASEDNNTPPKKKLWQFHNTRKLDAIRTEIDRLDLNKIEKSVVLTSLIQSLDRVDSTMGHFTSYLRNWSKRSNNSLCLKVPQIIESKEDHEICRGDIFDTIKNVKSDLAYLDPPYGSNNEKMPASRVRYASYYHIWTTVILNDEPEVFGASNRRVDSRDKISASVFEEFRKNEEGEFIAVKAIERLLKEIDTQYIILSYSTGGRATMNNLMDSINSVGRIITIKEIDYQKNVMADMRWTNEWVADVESKNVELLFLIEKD